MLHFACLSSGRGPFEGMSREPARPVDLSGDPKKLGSRRACEGSSAFRHARLTASNSNFPLLILSVL